MVGSRRWIRRRRRDNWTTKEEALADGEDASDLKEELREMVDLREDLEGIEPVLEERVRQELIHAPIAQLLVACPTPASLRWPLPFPEEGGLASTFDDR